MKEDNDNIKGWLRLYVALMLHEIKIHDEDLIDREVVGGPWDGGIARVEKDKTKITIKGTDYWIRKDGKAHVINRKGDK